MESFEDEEFKVNELLRSLLDSEFDTEFIEVLTTSRLSCDTSSLIFAKISLLDISACFRNFLWPVFLKSMLSQKLNFVWLFSSFCALLTIVSELFSLSGVVMFISLYTFVGDGGKNAVWDTVTFTLTKNECK